MLKEDTMGLDKTFKMAYVWQALGDYKTYLQVGIYIGLLIPVYSISLFTPTIVRGLGYSAANAQLLTIPPFVAGCIATIAGKPAVPVLRGSILIPDGTFSQSASTPISSTNVAHLSLAVALCP